LFVCGELEKKEKKKKKKKKETILEAHNSLKLLKDLYCNTKCREF
jgi:hypothetical protein